MIGDKNDNQPGGKEDGTRIGTKTDIRGSGTGGTNPSPSSGGGEDSTRIGTKTDIREADAQKSGEESPAKDKLRDGT